MKSKRAQAAFEYISTYGWAFLSILVTIGALTYFGIFDMTMLRSNDCSFPPGVVCNDYIISTTYIPGGALVLNLTNNLGADLDITDMSGTSDLGDFTTCYDEGGSLSTWDYEEAKLFICEPDEALSTRERYEVVVRMNFTQQGGTYPHYTVGTVSAAAQ